MQQMYNIDTVIFKMLEIYVFSREEENHKLNDNLVKMYFTLVSMLIKQPENIIRALFIMNSFIHFFFSHSADFSLIKHIFIKMKLFNNEF